MDTMSKTHTPEKSRFLVQVIRLLLICIKQLNHLPPEIDSDRFRKAIEDFNEAVDREQEMPALQNAFLRCRTGILAHAQLEKHYLKSRDSELREIISVLVRNLSIYHEESQGNLSELERCTDQLQLATRLDDLAALRKVLEGQVEIMQRKIMIERQHQGLLLSKVNDQVGVLNRINSGSDKALLTDAMTGAGSRRGLEHALEQRIDEAVINGKTFAVLMWDVDNFGGIKDRFGNMVGDGVLKTLVKQNLRLIRGGDYIGRVEDDSFAVILEDVDLTKARGRANDILHSVASLDIMLNGPSRTHRLRATISIGVAVFALGDSVAGLLKRAEMAVRKAKASGKNQVAVEGR